MNHDSLARQATRWIVLVAGGALLCVGGGCAGPDDGAGGDDGADGAVLDQGGGSSGGASSGGASSGGQDTSASSSGGADTKPTSSGGGTADGQPCDDGDPCTFGDRYVGGKCGAGVDVCECRENTDCQLLEDGDACNGTLICNKAKPPYRCVVAPPTIVQCPTDKDTACATNTCDPASGQCALKPVAKGTPCEDGDPCTPAAQCENGACKALSANQCECQNDADCGKVDDGNACNGTLFCAKSVFPPRCAINPASVVQCPADDGKACTVQACNPDDGKCAATARDKVHDPCKTVPAGCVDPLTGAGKGKPANLALACEDGDPCTVGESCKDGECAAETASSNVCICKSNADCAKQDDGDLCNGVEYCDTTLKQAKCVTNPATVIKCPTAADSACVKSTCDPKTAACAMQQVIGPCDDGNACTDKDLCAAGKCVGLHICKCTTDKDCEGKGDGNLCNGLAYCDKASGTCQDNPSTVVQCPTVGDTVCAKNACDGATGKCAMTAIERAKQFGCEDGGEFCRWEQLPKDAPDNSATKNAPCDDGNACSKGDVCAAGKCTVGKQIVCECTGDLDCAGKDDGDKCNGTWFCDLASKPAKCVENKAKVFCPPQPDGGCLDSACDAFDGECKLKPRANKTPCTDGGLCVTKANCQQGKCTGDKVNCDDKDACTIDSCDPKTGCVHVPKKCVDGNQCTVDSCDTGTGECSFQQKDYTLCNVDNDGCTINDICLAGACKVGKPASCAQPADPCQKGVCSSTGANSFTCATAPRKEGEACAGGKHCQLASVCGKDGKCQGKGDDRLASVYTAPAAGSVLVHRSVAPTETGYIVAGVMHGAATSAWYARRFDKALKSTGAEAGLPGGAVAPEAGAHGVWVTDDGGLLLVGATVTGKDAKNPNYDFTAVRRDKAGKTTWQAKFDVKDSEPALATSVTAHPQGGYIVGGWGKHGGDDVGYVVRVAAQAGLQMWRTTTDAAEDHRIYAVTTDEDGYVYVAGSHDSGSGVDGWVASLSSSGEVDWSSDIGATGAAVMRGIAVDQDDGDVFVAGTQVVKGVGTALIASLDDTEGDTDGPVAIPIVLDVRALSLRADGLLLIAGGIPTSKATSQGFVGAFDTDGSKVWSKSYGTSAAGTAVHSVVSVPYDGFVAAGSSDKGSIVTRADDWGHKSCATSGVCATMSQINCHDFNACTSDSCDPAKGCVHVHNTLPCQDGDACTEGEKCAQGKCVGGSDVDCDDLNACTADVCSKKAGCVHTKLSGTKCPDGDQCTVDETCVAGVCKPKPLGCDDNNPCTDDACVNGLGCTHEKLDKTSCGLGKVCVVGKCVKLWATKVAVGQMHSCAVDGGGGAKCWGQYGAMGVGKKPPFGNFFPSPEDVVNIDPLTVLDGADNHACGLTNLGHVFCWGYNQIGECGLGKTGGASYSTPQGTTVTKAVHVAVNNRGSCAAKADGTAWCWGANNGLQTGHEDGGATYVPTLVKGVNDAVQVAVGASHSCILGKSGKAWCLGNNSDGQLGIGTLLINGMPATPTPQQVKGLTGAVQIAGSHGTSCARKSDGTVWCWGQGESGALGNGSTAKSNAPSQVLLPKKATYVAVGDKYGCAIQEDATLRCWGHNQYGNLGTGNTFNTSTPILVKGLSNVVHVATYQRHTCAATGNGEVHCWGDNSGGVIGNGKAEQNKIYATPQLVPQSKAP